MMLEALTRIIRTPFDPSRPDIMPGQRFRASDYDEAMQASIRLAIAAGEVLIDGRLPTDIDPENPVTISLSAYGVTEATVTRETLGVSA